MHRVFKNHKDYLRNMMICFDCFDCEDVFAITLQSNLVDSILIPILAVMFKFFEWKDFLAVKEIILKKEDYLSETVQLFV